MMSAYPTRDEEFGGQKPVEARHRIDEAKLDDWMSANVAGYAAPLSLLQFKGGQSNPTYRVKTAAASYVLRRKPSAYCCRQHTLSSASSR
jgi:aminoglycoside phosphotransferase (APT) family kinase protein